MAVVDQRENVCGTDGYKIGHVQEINMDIFMSVIKLEKERK